MSEKFTPPEARGAKESKDTPELRAEGQAFVANMEDLHKNVTDIVQSNTKWSAVRDVLTGSTRYMSLFGLATGITQINIGDPRYKIPVAIATVATIMASETVGVFATNFIGDKINNNSRKIINLLKGKEE